MCTIWFWILPIWEVTTKLHSLSQAYILVVFSSGTCIVFHKQSKSMGKHKIDEVFLQTLCYKVLKTHIPMKLFQYEDLCQTDSKLMLNNSVQIFWCQKGWKYLKLPIAKLSVTCINSHMHQGSLMSDLNFCSE